MAPRPIDPRRLDEVQRRYLSAQPTGDIERECAEEFGVTRRQVQKYLAIVRKRLAAAVASVSKDEHRARIEALVLGAYQLAATPHGESGNVDPKGMVAAAKVLAEIHGVIGPRQIELTGKDGGPIKVDDARDRIRDRIARLAGASGAGTGAGGDPAG